MKTTFFYHLWVALILQWFDSGFAHEILQTVKGTVGAENYTYYRLSRPGTLLIELESESGDADIFVSSETLKPTFDNYEIQSITCGKDVVEIPTNFERPFGIGIYGHFSEEISTYKVTIYLAEKKEELDYDQLTHHYYDYEAADHVFYNFEASDYMFRDVKPHPRQKTTDNTAGAQNRESSGDVENEDGSVLWQILLTLLKVVFEVIL